MAVRGGSNDATLPSIASETVGTDQAQVVRLDKGAATTRVPVTDSDGLPIEGVAGGTPVPVSGTVAVTGVATETTLAAIVSALGSPLQAGGAVALDAAALAALESITVVGPLTDAQLRAAAVPVSGAFWQATQPVSGPLTDAELRATAVPVAPAGLSGTALATAVTVGTTAAALPASALANRKSLLIQNKGSVSIYIGGAAVTTAAGIEVQPGQSWPMDVGAAALYAISGTAGQDVRVLEVS